MKTFVVEMRATFRGTATLDAETKDEAEQRFKDGSFEFDTASAELIDWRPVGRTTEDT